MALTAKQNIPERPKAPSESWSVRRLFPLKALTSALTKVFVNPFDVLLGFLILILGSATLIGQKISAGFWVLSVCLLIADLLERETLSQFKK